MSRAVIERVVERALSRWRIDKPEAVRYTLAVAVQLNAGSRAQLLERLPVLLVARVRQLLDAHQHRREERMHLESERIRIDEERCEVQAQQRALEHAAVILSLQRIKDRLTGPASVRFLATLRPRDRDEIASADERRAAIQLRKQMLTTTALKERGWTRSMIIKLLGRPDTLAPSFYGTMRWLFFIDRVERVEGSAEFRAWHNKQRSVSR